MKCLSESSLTLHELILTAKFWVSKLFSKVSALLYTLFN